MDLNKFWLIKLIFRMTVTLTAAFSILSCTQNGGNLVDSLVGIKGSLLDGEGVGNDSLTFSPNPLDFGNIAVGTTTSVSTISVLNSGKVTVKLLSITLPSENTDLTLETDGTCLVGNELTVNSACTIRVQYQPSVSGKFQSKVSFEFAPTADLSRIYTNQANIIGNAVAPLSFDGIQPIIASEVSTSRVTVHWTPVDGASAYIISQNDNGTVTSVGSTAATDSSFTITGLTHNSIYKFRVNALNVLGIPDTNTKDELATTDDIGVFAPMPNLAASEGLTSTTGNLATYCTDSENNSPQLMIINSQSDTDLHCSMLSSPYRLACTPGFKDGSSNWQGSVEVKCLLNDYPTPYTQTITVNVSNIFRAPTLAFITGQNATAGTAITPIQAVASSTDESSFTYSCQFDQSVDGTVSNAAASCNTLLNQDLSNASFTSSGLFNWTPRLVDGAKSFEFKVKATGDTSGLNDTKIFVINVGYPPPSPSQSTIAASSSVINSGNASTITVTVKDSSGNTIPVGGASVVFSNTGGTSTGTFSTVVDHGDGTYTTNFTGVLSGTATTITATVQGSNITSTLPTVQVNPGVISTARSLVSVSSSTVISGQSITLNLQAKDAAGNIITTGGSAIVFTRSGGVSTGVIGATTDNANGTYSATFTGVLSGSATTIGAKINTVNVTTTLPSVTVLPGPVSLSQSLVSVVGTPSTLAAGSAVQVSLTSKDAAGNLITVGGLTVAFGYSGGASNGSFGAVFDNLDGTYSTVFTATTSGSPSSFSATIGGANVTSSMPSLTVVPGPPSLSQSVTTVTSSAINSGGTSTISLKAYDAYGNALTSGGNSVSFSYSGGTSTGTIGTVSDGGNGTYTAIFTGVLSGTATTINTSIDSAPASYTPKPTITVSPGVISSSKSTITLSSSTVASGASINVTLTAKDAAGNNLTNGGSVIAFTRTGGSSTGTFSGVTDLNNGQYTTTFTGLIAGTATTIGATIGGVAVTTTLPTIIVTPGTISTSSSIISVLSSTINSGNGTTITLQAKDAAGNNLIAGGSTVNFSYSGGSSTLIMGTVTDNANGTYSAPVTGFLAGTPTNITATINSSNVTSTLPQITVLPGPSSPTNSLITATASTVTSGTSITLTLQTMDAAGNIRTTGGETIAFTYAGGTSTGTISTVTDAGNGSYTATFTGVLSGTATTINATINGTPVTSTPKPTVSVNPGLISTVKSTVSVSSSTVASGNSINITLTAKDAAGNLLTTGGSAIAFSRSGGVSNGSFGGTVDNNNGTYSASFTGTTSGTPTTINATIAGAAVTSPLPTVQVTPGAISANTSVLTLSSSTVNSGSSISITLQAKDAASNTITTGGAAVSFAASGGTSTGTISSITDNNNGTYTANFTGITSGTATTITCNIGGIELTTTLPTVTVNPGVISTATSVISVSSSLISSGTASTLTLTAKDAAGNLLTSGGAVVAFSHSGGTSTGSISSTTNVGNGTYTATFTGILSGTATSITATISASPVTNGPAPTIVVIPGSISLSQTSITTSSSTVSSGQNITVTLQSKDAAGNNITSGGATVAFSRSGGSSTGNFGAVVDNNNGTYSTTFTGLVAGTGTTIQATIGGANITSALPSVTVVPGLISASTSTVTASSSNVNSGSSIILTLNAFDANNNPLTSGGSSIVFGFSGGSSTGTIGTTTDNANGTYTANFTGVLAGTPTTINATIAGASVGTSMPNITVTPGAPSLAKSLITASASTISSGGTVTLTLQARDAAENIISVGGSAVAFTASGGTSTGIISTTSDPNTGIYTATFTGVTSGTATTIGATINSAIVTSTPKPTIAVTPGTISVNTSTLSVASSSVNSGSSILVTLQAKDAAGNNLTTGGSTIAFSRSGGSSTGNFGTVTDVGNGTYTALFTGVTAGTATTINATIGGSTVLTSAPTVTVTPGPISPLTSTITVANSSVASGSSVAVTLQGKDAAGNNVTVGGSTIIFSNTGGGSTGSFSATVDNGNGTYSSSFTGDLAGSATSVSATIAGSAILTTLPTITVLPGPASPNTSLITASSTSLTSGSNITITLQAKDAAGNLLTTGGDTIAFSYSGGASTGTFSAVNNVGDGTYTATFTGVLAGTATTINGTVNGSPITSTPKPNVTVTPGTISTSQSLVTVASSSVSSGSNVLVTLTAKDAAGNNLTTSTSTIAFNRSGGSSTGSFSAVTNNNNGTFTASFTGTLAGTATTINATIDGNPVTSVLPTVTVTPGAISASTSTLAVSSSTVNSGSSTTVTLTGKDAAGNTLISGGASVLFSNSGGTSTGTFGSVSDNGNGTYSVTFTGFQSGTATTITSTIGGNTVTTTLPTITVNPGAPSVATSLITSIDSTLSSGSSTTIKVQAKDAAGNLITTGGATIVFSHSGGTSTGSITAAIDNTNGTYTATFTGVLSGTATTINATLNGSPITTAPKPTITVTPGAISVANSTITIDSGLSSVASGSSVTLRLTSKDSAGNAITSGGQTITFGYAGGTSTGTIGSVLDNLDGTYTASFVGAAAGTATTISATVGGVTVTTNPHPTLVVTPGPVSTSSSVITVASSTIQSGLSTLVTLTTKDTYGNFLTTGGSTIVFSRTGGTSTGTFSAQNDNSNGTYTITFTGVTSGTPTNISATINGAAITSTLPTVTVNPGPPSIVTSLISTSVSTVASGSNVTLTLTAYDVGGNAITTGGAIVAFSYLGGTATGTISSTNDNGNGTYTATFTGVTAGSATSIKATINGSSVSTTSPTIVVTPGPASIANSTLTVASSSVASGSTVLVTLQAKDAANNNLTAAGETVVFSRSGGTSTGSFSATTDNLNGTYSATFTGVTAGTPTTITASIGGSAITTTLPTMTVTPGPVSVAHSTLSASASTIASGGVVTLTLQAKDAANNNLTTGGATIALSAIGGTATGTLSSVTDNTNGTYTATFTGLLAGTATTISSQINGNILTTTLPTIAVTPGAISTATSTVTASSSSVSSGNAVTLTLQAKDAAGNNLVVGGSTVAFSYSGGTSTGNISTTTDNSNGTYSATFTGLIAGTATTINTTIGGVAVTTSNPTIQVLPGSISIANSLLTITSSTVASGSSVTLTLQAKDANNNNLTSGGSTVVFTKAGGTATGTLSATTDVGNGTYTGTFTGILAGSAITLGATIGGAAITTTLPTITVIPGPISLSNSFITPSASTVASGSAITLTLTTKDSAGNFITTGGASISFSYSGGTSTGSVGSANDNGDGTYTANFTGVTAGTATTLGATANGSNITSSLPTVQVTPGTLSLATSVITLSASTVLSGSSINLTLTTKDAAGNLLSTGGRTVVFSHSGGTATGSISGTIDNNNGTYSATFTGLVSGSATSIRATVNGSLVTSTSPSVVVNPGAISLANTTVTTSISSVASGNTSTLTLTARDSNNNLITNGAYAVTFSTSGGSSTGSIGSVTDNLDGTYTTLFTGLVAGTATTLSATVNSSNVTSTMPQITVVPGLASAAHSTISLSPSTIASGSSSTITLTAKDANGNSLTTGGLTVIFSSSGGTSTGTISATTNVGNGTYTATYTGILSGTATTISATLSGNAVSSTANLTVIPGPISLANSTISVGSSTVASGTTTLLTLTARDSAGNTLTTGGSSVVFSRTGGTSTGNISATTDNNNGTYSATFNGITAGTATDITATIGGSSITSSLPNITVIPGTISSSQSTIAVSASTVSSGLTSTITLQAKDVNGNNLTSGGATIVFGRTGGTSTGSLSTAIDNTNGTYNSTFTGLVSGTATSITATINGVSVSSSLPTITVIPGAISGSTSTIAAASSSINSGTTTGVTLTARDAGGNIITSGISSVTFSFTGGTSTGTFSSVTDNLNGTHTATLTGVISGSPSFVHAVVDGVTITSTPPPVQVVVGAFSASNSSISVSNASIASGNTTTFTLIARDINNNNFDSGSATVVFNISGGTSNGTLATVTDNNNGTYSAVFTGTTAGSAVTVGGTYNGVSITSTLPTLTVTPGSISASQSLISVSSSTVTSGSNITITLQAKDASNNTITTGGQTIAFTYNGGSSTGSISAATDNNNGTYTASFTGVIAGTATTIKGSINGSNVSSSLPTVTVNAGTISTAQSNITLSQSSITAGATLTATLHAKDAAGNSISSGGSTVVFDNTGGVSDGTFGSTTDVTNGTYTAVFTGTTIGSPTAITATIGGVSITSTLPTVTVTPGVISLSQSLISVSASSIASGASGTVTLQAKDAYGNNLTTGGSTIVFNRSGGSSTLTIGGTTDNSNGTYSATYTGLAAGSATTMGATVGGSAVTSTPPTVTVTPGSASVAQSLVSVSSSTVNSGSSITLTLQAKDASGNNLTTGGLLVVFTRSGGVSNGTIGSTTDLGNGTYTATFTGTTAGSATSISATIGGVALTSSPSSLTVLPGVISVATSLISVSSSSLASGANVTVTLTAKDAAGNSLTSGGSTVLFSHSGGTSDGSFSSVTDSTTGTYTATFTGTTAGTATSITATIGGINVTSTLPTVTVTPGAFSLSQSYISLSSATVSSGSSITATLRARDANNNNLTTGTLTVVFSRTGGTSNGTFGSTVDNNDGTYSNTFTGTTAGTATSISATINGSTITSTLPTATVTPGSFSLAQSLVSVSSSTISSGATSTLTLTARDANNNSLTTGGLTVAFSRSGGSSTGSIGPVTDNNNGTYTAVFTGVTSGTATDIHATIGGSTVTSTAPTITVNPGTVSLAQSSISTSASSVVSGSSIVVTLQAKDSAGNNITSNGLTVTFGHAGGTSTGSFGAVVDNNNGTYSANFTGALAGTSTSITATIGGASVTSSSPMVSVTYGAVSVATSTVSVSADTISSGFTTTVTLQAKDSQGNNIAVGGLTTVAFGISGGGSSGTFGAVSDNSNGTYSSVFTGTTNGSATTVVATIGGATVSTTMPTITVNAGATTAANSVITISNSSVVAGNTRTITLQARDSSNNNITTGGLTVLFNISGGTSSGTISAVTDHGNGTYSATITGTTAGSASTIGGTVDGSTVTSSLPTLTVSPGTISKDYSTVTVSSNTVTSGNTVLVTLQAKDAYNNNITTGGSTILFSNSGGTSTGTFSSVTDNSNGTYQANFQGNNAGTATTLSATIGGQTVTTSMPTVTVSAGSFSLAYSSVTLSSSSVTSSNTVTATLQVRDASNNNITTGGASVSFFRTGGVSNVTFSSVTDNNNGTYTVTLTGTTSGSATSIGANIGGSPISSSLPSLTVNPGTISTAQSLVTTSLSTVASGSTATITLSAKDSNGNSISTGSSTVVFARSGGTSNGTIGAVTDHGNGTYTATFTGSTAGSSTTITATINSDPVTSTLPTITVVPGTISLSQSTVTITGNPSTVASGSSVTAILTTKDASGNNIGSGGLTTVTFTQSGGTSTGSFGSVIDNNDGTYSATFTGSASGTATTIQGRIAGTLLTSSFPTISVVPGSVSLTNSLLSLSSSSITSGSSLTATITTKDNYGNQLNTGGLSASYNASGGTSTGTFGSVTDNNNGTYTATWTGVLAGTATSLVGRIGVQDLLSAAQSATVTPGAISASGSYITLSSNSVTSGSTITVTLNGRDAAGNSITGGTSSTIIFSNSGGTSTGTFSSVTAQGNETYASNFQGLVAGTQTTISATVNGVAVTTTLPTVSVTPGAVSLAQSTLSVSPSSITSGSTSTFTLTTRDANNNIITGGSYTITMSLTGGGTSSGTIGSITNNGNGTYTATFTGTTAGTTKNVTASINGSPITSSLPSIAVTAGAISLAKSQVSVSTSSLTVGNTATLTLTAYDSNDNAITTGGLTTVAFGIVSGSGTSNGTIDAAVDNGNGTYSATFHATTTGSPISITSTIAGTPVSWTPLPTIQVVSLPVLINIPSNLTMDPLASNPLRIGNTLTFDIAESTSGDSGMTYACHFDRLLDDTMTSPTACTSLPGTISFNTSSGVFSWTPNTLAWGVYEIRLQGTNTIGTGTYYLRINIQQAYPTSNLLVDLQADFANGGENIGQNTTPINTWENLKSLSPALNATLTNFLFNSTSGWNGTTDFSTDPMHLRFLRTSSNYLNFGTHADLQSATSTTISSYIKITEPTYLSTSTESNNTPPIIWSSGGFSTNYGMALSQSPAEGLASSGGSGTLDLIVAGVKPWILAQNIPATFKLRMNETGTIASLSDTSSNAYSFSIQGGFTPSAVTAANSALYSHGESDGAIAMPSGSGGPSNTARWFYNSTQVAYHNSASHVGAWELWFKTGASTSGALAAISTNKANGMLNCDTENDLVIYINSGKISFKIYNGTTSSLITSGGSTTYNDSTWHHLVINWNSSGGLNTYPSGSGSTSYANMYIDNNLVASSTTAISYTAKTTLYYAIIGGGQFHDGTGSSGSSPCSWSPSGAGFTKDNPYGMFDGSLDEIHFYNGNNASTTMISQRYNSKRCRSTTNFNSSPANTKYHDVVVTFDNSTKTAKMYVDKNLECTQTYTGADVRPTGSNFTVGGNPAGTTGRYWSGYMSDFKIYNSVLDSTNVNSLYDALSPRHP